MKKIWRMLGCILYILAWSLPAVMADSSTDMFRMMQPIELNTQLTDLDIQVSLLYDNMYTEAVLLPGKSLTGELKIKNTGQEAKNIQFILAIYDKDQTLCGIQFQEKMIEPKMTEQMRAGVQVPDNAQGCTGKVMIWDNYNNISPYTHVTITVENNDYFGDDYTVFQPLLSSSEAMGSISSPTDRDVFEFTATQNGLYVFETYGEADVYAVLYEEGKTTEEIGIVKKSKTDQNKYELGATLENGKKYYLYVGGDSVGTYNMRAYYAIGGIWGTISPVKCGENNKFNEVVEGTVTLSSYDTNEFVASIHLKEWSQPTSTEANFILTGIQPGEYLVTIYRPGYLSRYMKITINNNIVDLGTKELIPGDVDGNNIIDQTDLKSIKDKMGVVYGSAGYLVNADVNADQKITQEDWNIANQNLRKTSNDYGENINVVICSIKQSSDGTVTIEGSALKGKKIYCDIYSDQFAVFSDAMICEDGTYRFKTKLLKDGVYRVHVTADDRAYRIDQKIYHSGV